MLEDEERLHALCKSKQYEWVRDYVQTLDNKGVHTVDQFFESCYDLTGNKGASKTAVEKQLLEVHYALNHLCFFPKTKSFLQIKRRRQNFQNHAIVKCRSLASMLRAPRASSVRQGMRAGELSVAAVCALDPAEVLQSDAQKEAKQAKRERDDRGIESVRIKNLANQSAVGAFRCKVPECDGKEAIAYGMSSMGLETPASGGDRPSVVYECLTCGDRSSE